MDAGTLRCVVCMSVLSSLGAVHRTPNFTVSAESETVARQVGQTAEACRRRLAVEWLGQPMPKWSAPCPIRVKVGQIGAGGATTFSFDRGEVFGWKMTVQGSLERILDSVIPHEVSHTIFASHFRRPLPRWADEGAATLVEHESERRRQTLLLNQVLRNRTRIPLRRLLAMTEYPAESRGVMSLYAQGYSLADFLVEQGGRKRYLEFLDVAHKSGWDKAIRQCYKHAGVERLEERWRGWVLAGSPRISAEPGTLLAVNTRSPLKQNADLTIRGQSPGDKSEKTNIGLPAAPDPRPRRIAAAAPASSQVSDHDAQSRSGRDQAQQAGWAIVDASGRRSRRSLVAPVLRVERPHDQRMREASATAP